MDPLTAVAIVISTEIDLEASKEEREISSQPRDAQQETPIQNPPAGNESTPLLNPSNASTCDTERNEKALQDDIQDPTSSSPTSTEWPPTDAPKWFWLFGWKFSQRFLSPAERPPVFSRWYHILKILWPPLIMDQFLTPRPNPNQRELHPQAAISILMCMGTVLVKLAMGLLLYCALHLGGDANQDQREHHVWDDNGIRLGLAEAWTVILFIFCYNPLYWRSGGKLMARLRLSFFVVIAFGMWVAAWRASAWEWRAFWVLGMPFSALVSISYGIALERWV
ncbi:MAG: hypothetical protein Q9166_007687 [cf. Caloplaca sp. 2 TL-2023]